MLRQEREGSGSWVSAVKSMFMSSDGWKSRRQIAAVDGQHDAGDKGRGARAKENHRACNVGGTAPSLIGVRARTAATARGVVLQALGQRRYDPAGSDCVDADALGAQAMARLW